MDARRYKLFGNAELSKLQHLAERCVSSWSDEWFVGKEHLQVRCFPLNSSFLRNKDEGVDWLRCGAGEDWVAAALDDDAAVQLTLRLLHGNNDHSLVANGDHKSFLVSHVLRQSMADLVRSHLSRLRGDGNPQQADIAEGTALPEWIFDTGSAAVLIEIRVGDAVVLLVVSPNLSVSVCEAKTGTVPELQPIDFRKALRFGNFELQVMAGEAEIEIGALETLSVGDVIRLNTKVDAPFSLIDSEGTQMGKAFLGIFDGNKAVQLAK